MTNNYLKDWRKSRNKKYYKRCLEQAKDFDMYHKFILCFKKAKNKGLDIEPSCDYALAMCRLPKPKGKCCACRTECKFKGMNHYGRGYDQDGNDIDELLAWYLQI